MNKFLLTISSLLFSINSFAQQEGSVFTATGRAGVSTTFVTDYQALGINPANLGLKPLFEKKKFTMGYSETGVSIFSGALTKNELKSAYTNFSDTNFTHQQKLNAASKFAFQPFAINIDATYFGFSAQWEKFGGIAFSIKEKINWYSKFNDTISSLAFLGYASNYFDSLLLSNGTAIANNPQNLELYKDSIQKGIASFPQKFSSLFEGSQINLLWYREYSLGYGRQALSLGDLNLVAGGGVKFIQGFGIMETRVEDGKLYAFGAFSPVLGIDFGSAAITNPSTITQTSWLPKPVGIGLGFDIGATLVFKENTKVAVSVTDIGSITYTGNVYEIQDTFLLDLNTDGFNSFNFFSEMSKIAGENSIFKWKGEEKIKATLPSMVRIGASQKFFNILEVGADIVAPVTDGAGNFDKALLSLGAEITLFKKLRLSSGIITGGNYGDKKNIPLGVTFIAPGGSWEGGIASRDAVTWFTTESPNLSFAFGFLRFRM